MFVENLYAAGEAAAPAAGAEGPGMFQAFLPLIIIFALFYFMFIMPQKKEQKKHQAMLKALKPGDKVVTSGGIVGVIEKINEADEVVRIKSGENTQLNIKRGYISAKIVKEAEPEKK